MTRTVRARRAERANQPLYARALRLRHLAPSGLLCFVFLEGTVVLGVLLALAELVSWWGVIVLPVTVALMVKFNDLVAGALTPRPAVAETTSARAAVLRPATMQGYGQVAPDSGFAPSVPSGAPATDPAGYGEVTFPAGSAGSEWARSGRAEGAGADPQSSQRAGLRVAVSRSAAWSNGSTMPVRPATSSSSHRAGDVGPAVAPMAEQAGGYAVAGSPLAERTGGYAPIVSQEPSAVGYGPDDMAGAPAVGYPGSYSRGFSGNEYSQVTRNPYGGEQAGGVPDSGDFQARSGEEPRGNSTSTRRPWADQLDVRQQMARQAASRRYE
ncbi:hypothetical protein [Actinoplanes sandaracinus]|uniref:hypothetical protein n=1 Tax=Actinoplanes sandaracinus TaxID=3045177 RepID=UPI003898FCEE